MGWVHCNRTKSLDYIVQEETFVGRTIQNFLVYFDLNTWLKCVALAYLLVSIVDQAKV